MNPIRAFYKEVPRTYEAVNHVLTLGLDAAWRRKAARWAAEGGGGAWLDVCSGTGEMAVYLRRLAPPGTRICASDFSPEMLAVARSKPEAAGIEFVEADVTRLPFQDASFDLVTISFAVRNIAVTREHFRDALREIQRVLKPGGRCVSVETSRPRSRVVRGLYHAYVRAAVRPLGQAISGARAPYAYLSRSIPRFCTADEYAGLLKEAGFSAVEVRPVTMGVVAIHRAVK